jgi:hypothetical protein
LRVAVLPTARTGLPGVQNEFYFGNLVSETGNTDTTDFTATYVTATDLGGTSGNQTATADVLNRYDHDRDGDVDSADVDLVRNNAGTEMILLDLR